MRDKTPALVYAVFIGLVVLSLLTACSTTTTITDNAGSEYIVNSRNDAIVTHEKDGMKVTVDNRGRRSIFEDLMGAYFLRWMQDDEKE